MVNEVITEVLFTCDQDHQDNETAVVQEVLYNRGHNNLLGHIFMKKTKFLLMTIKLGGTCPFAPLVPSPRTVESISLMDDDDDKETGPAMNNRKVGVLTRLLGDVITTKNSKPIASYIHMYLEMIRSEVHLKTF